MGVRDLWTLENMCGSMSIFLGEGGVHCFYQFQRDPQPQTFKNPGWRQEWEAARCAAESLVLPWSVMLLAA